MKLDIACGQNKHEGFFGIDIASCAGVDLVHDLNQYPWPIESDSVDEVICSHYFEHVEKPMDFMNELYRIMKAGAKATIVTPYYTSIRCWQDPTHKNAISEATYYYYNKGWRDANRLDHYPIHCDFDVQFGHSINANWRGRSQPALQFAINHYWNVIDDIHAIMTKR